MSERLNEANDFDVLGDVLETLRFRGSIFFRSELAAPWGMSLEEETFPRFHIAMSGDCFVGASDDIFLSSAQWEQIDDPARNPVIWERVDDDWDCERLAAERDDLFPPLPATDW